MKTIYLAGGCFWGMQKYFDLLPGVFRTAVGYANGNTENPTYEDVKKNSGHAETVRVEFDEQILPPEKLLDAYFAVIDPFSVNRQGEDEGIQYRTGIYYDDDSLLPAIRAAYRKVRDAAGRTPAVELKPLRQFFEAEEYHQKYLEKNPAGYCHIPEEMFRAAEEKEAAVTFNVYERYFEAECVYNEVERKAADVLLIVTSEGGNVSYEYAVNFFPHRDEEDFAISYDAYASREIYSAKGRRSKKREEEFLKTLEEEADALAESLGGKIFWDKPLIPERRG